MKSISAYRKRVTIDQSGYSILDSPITDKILFEVARIEVRSELGCNDHAVDSIGMNG